MTRNRCARLSRSSFAALLGARVFRGESGADPAPDIMVIGHGQAMFDALSDIPNRGQRLCALGFP